MATKKKLGHIVLEDGTKEDVFGIYGKFYICDGKSFFRSKYELIEDKKEKKPNPDTDSLKP
jgi:hypothetical protein